MTRQKGEASAIFFGLIVFISVTASITEYIEMKREEASVYTLPTGERQMAYVYWGRLGNNVELPLHQDIEERWETCKLEYKGITPLCVRRDHVSRNTKTLICTFQKETYSENSFGGVYSCKDLSTTQKVNQ